MVRVESVRFVGEINITLGYCRNKTFGFNQICECMDSIIKSYVCIWLKDIEIIIFRVQIFTNHGST